MTNEYEKQYIAQLLNDEELFNHTRILPKYLSNEINKKIYKQFNPDIILLRVATSNKRAIKCYLNSNFKIFYY